MSMLDEMEDGTVTISSPSTTDAAGEIKKRRGRPPGSKNKPKGAEVESLSASLENAIRGLFAIAALLAGWFGYEQTEELTDSEAKEGARAFAPIAVKVPWLANVAMYIGAPVWLIVTMRRKFARVNNANANGNGSGPRVVANGERQSAQTAGNN